MYDASKRFDKYNCYYILYIKLISHGNADLMGAV
jgi:hypothetical protein